MLALLPSLAAEILPNWIRARKIGESRPSQIRIRIRIPYPILSQFRRRDPIHRPGRRQSNPAAD
jgi:hypothetical protein